MNTGKQRVLIPASAKGMRLSEYLAGKGYPLNAPCGGKGTCGKCRVTVVRGTFSASPISETAVSDIGKGEQECSVLACQVYCTGEEAEILLPVNAGSGLTDFSAAEDTEQQSIANNNTAEPSQNNSAYDVALDIGTTTLAAALICRADGSILHTVSRLNPQQSFGADVMTRIGCIMQEEGKLYEMQRILLKAVREMLSALNEKAGRDCDAQFLQMAVAGNTTMLHIFCGISPAGIGTYPFTPAFTEERIIAGKTLDLPVEEVIVLPSASAFIGGDITAGVYMSRMMNSTEPAVLIDIGTNGEMVLFTGTSGSGELYAASAAAGPAMEGAGISTGVGGVPGAVCSVKWISRGKSGAASSVAMDDLFVQTIDNAAPVGICGSGLIDLIAVLLDTGALDETGYFEDEEIVYAENGETALSINQEDIRAFQLAKGAIRAGLTALCDAAKLCVTDLRTIYLAGGLGYYMNVDAAVRVGLLPDTASGVCRVRSIGNSALGGAVLRLTEKTAGAEIARAEIARAEIARIAAACRTVELNSSPVFTNAFMEEMMFPLMN